MPSPLSLLRSRFFFRTSPVDRQSYIPAAPWVGTADLVRRSPRRCTFISWAKTHALHLHTHTCLCVYSLYILPGGTRNCMMVSLFYGLQCRECLYDTDVVRLNDNCGIERESPDDIMSIPVPSIFFLFLFHLPLLFPLAFAPNVTA